MADPIVHIGYHKTATTWFQKSVYPRVTNLTYIPRARVKRAFLSASALHFDPAWTRAALEIPEGMAPILCEEELSGYLHTGGLMGFLSKEMAQRIRAVFPSAHIVVFVRSQPEMIAACYQQYVRGGGTFAPQRYLWPADFWRAAAAQPYKIPRFSFDHFDYDRLIAHYIALFGPERVHVYAYEELQRGGPAFLERFAKELGLELDLASVSSTKQNVSYSRAINSFARVLNHFTRRTVNDKRTWLHIPFWYTVRRRLIEAANATGLFGARATPEDLLGAQTVAWIRQRYWESNRRLAQLARFDLTELGYPLDPPPAPAPRPQRPTWLRWTTK